MKIQWVLLSTGLLAFCQGCTSLANVACYSIIEPVLYCTCATDTADCLHFRLLALKVWLRYQSEHPDCPNSKDFAKGFKEGFADYLFAGGCGEPPPVPPRCYWTSKNETPWGHQAIKDWFQGFRVGAQVAKETGRRELVTVPSSLAPGHELPPSIATIPQASIDNPSDSDDLDDPPAPDPVPGRPEMLPPPKAGEPAPKGEILRDGEE